MKVILRKGEVFVKEAKLDELSDDWMQEELLVKEYFPEMFPEKYPSYTGVDDFLESIISATLAQEQIPSLTEIEVAKALASAAALSLLRRPLQFNKKTAEWGWFVRFGRTAPVWVSKNKLTSKMTKLKPDQVKEQIDNPDEVAATIQALFKRDVPTTELYKSLLVPGMERASVRIRVLHTSPPDPKLRVKSIDGEFRDSFKGLIRNLEVTHYPRVKSLSEGKALSVEFDSEILHARRIYLPNSTVYHESFVVRGTTGTRQKILDPREPSGTRVVVRPYIPKGVLDPEEVKRRMEESRSFRMKGVYKYVMAESINQYDRLGIDKILMNAHGDGRYISSKLGFDFASENQAFQARKAYETFLVKEKYFPPSLARSTASNIKHTWDLAKHTYMREPRMAESFGRQYMLGTTPYSMPPYITEIDLAPRSPGRIRIDSYLRETADKFTAYEKFPATVVPGRRGLEPYERLVPARSEVSANELPELGRKRER